ncbi:histidyl-tRNA synthetase, mitochondrial precursor [Talaromyces stipitatus ATCC 10500]|uniref:Histidine--tRNA ligase, mitochondrial n=1 Tax=Talaromyces stipitatus (strain ATCC 10500 / CBS 375.48 / QM 6759 / NRRL 1006) TaxID=441959 RepID=B8LXN5_TALSN|nr:histidyl-tRNA synthetase, mitochondrial precursor [Talaromyces stipitatus ATCC 10500]EED24536.1 histidyl-tRNA synthetase, mitochondrial precursor [Talaromyces stipitatus ATCC 10500]
MQATPVVCFARRASPARLVARFRRGKAVVGLPLTNFGSCKNNIIINNPSYRFLSYLKSPDSDDMGKDKDNKVTFNLKTPKGTRDWAGADTLIRDRIFSTITNVFRRHGGTALDTPVFELREILAGKYGEDSKLIYDLQDQGGELCSLRYDLTVPFARWLAMNPEIRSIKRYHIAKVYRRDQPAVAKGRMREFYQCDFDIAGANFDPMVPDAEVLKVINEVFEDLGWQGKFTIKINHRKVLDGMFEVCGVPQDKIRPISSAVDKLDKLPWADVRKEMVEDKGLDAAAADKIEKYVSRKGRKDLLEELLKDEDLMANAAAKQGIEEMGLLMDYLEAFGVLDTISFDLSLARGLDYYTGVIYEVVTEGSAPVTATSAPEAKNLQKSGKKTKSATGDDDDRSNDPTVGVGSIAAGGRYDNLVGMFYPKAQIPCVGISFGVDRIFSITKARMEKEKAAEMRSSEVDVYVMAFGGKGFTGMLKERMEICKTLWAAGVKAEFSYKLKPKLPQQFKAAETSGIPFGVILGEDELAAGQVKIKEMGLPEGHPEKEGVSVDIKNLVEEIKKRISNKNKGIQASATVLPESTTAAVADLTVSSDAASVPKTEDAGV